MSAHCIIFRHNSPTSIQLFAMINAIVYIRKNLSPGMLCVCSTFAAYGVVEEGVGGKGGEGREGWGRLRAFPMLCCTSCLSLSIQWVLRSCHTLHLRYTLCTRIYMLAVQWVDGYMCELFVFFATSVRSKQPQTHSLSCTRHLPVYYLIINYNCSSFY